MRFFGQRRSQRCFEGERTRVKEILLTPLKDSQDRRLRCLEDWLRRNLKKVVSSWTFCKSSCRSHVPFTPIPMQRRRMGGGSTCDDGSGGCWACAASPDSSLWRGSLFGCLPRALIWSAIRLKNNPKVFTCSCKLRDICAAVLDTGAGGFVWA